MDSTSKPVAVITGCSSGAIGNAMAREFHAHGLRVFATARNPEKMANLEELGIECLTLDVDDHESIAKCFANVNEAVSDQGVAYLVNSAGIDPAWPATETSLPAARAMFETNLFGVIDMNQTFLPLLCKAQGTIVHVGTVGAIAPVPWLSVYTASKAALYAYCDTMRLEVATLGVKVVYVRTGQVATNPRTETPAVKDSVYASVRPNKKSHDDGLKQGCKPEAYANQVVGRLLRGGSWWRNSWVLWAGNQAFEMRVIGWIAGNLPWDLWGFLMRRAYKLG